jgi:hypothetical protein
VFLLGASLCYPRSRFRGFHDLLRESVMRDNPDSEVPKVLDNTHQSVSSIEEREQETAHRTKQANALNAATARHVWGEMRGRLCGAMSGCRKSPHTHTHTHTRVATLLRRTSVTVLCSCHPVNKHIHHPVLIENVLYM